ncbi:cell division protein FtsQ/DivIB [Aliidiomarina soli]|uniref:Cell division protein FtsQ n=1 Tax=Aliidiomarina soli TaxID=1928574 RepID=A0A432WJX3_9GAMM|nr:cell division protein FtsQ/DivIB [Aliidiomarina soli]RUO34065.1 cell division protein DivIVA [Aliidiomarina soli]
MAVDWREVRWDFWFGLLSLVLLLVGIYLAGNWVYRVLMDEQQVPLDAIVLQGELVYTSSDEVRDALVAGEVGSFFGADMATLKARVEALPWIYSAAVRKEWPGRLRIFLVEQVPLAIWNDEALVNRDGEVFSGRVEQVEDWLPHLYGPPADIDEVMRQYLRIDELLQLNGYRIDELSVTERFSVSVGLEGGITLHLGREARLQRIQRFIDLHERLQRADDRDIDYVDLRYDTGVAVGWREE